jgi:hypothetical protein
MTEKMDIDLEKINIRKRKHKEYMVIYRKEHIKEAKKWRTDNKKHIVEYNKGYYEKTKNTLHYLNKYNKIVECECCHKKLQFRNMKKHLKIHSVSILPN